MLFNFFAGFCGSLFARSSRDRRHARQLRAMSDLELRDLGLGRSEIPAMFSADTAQRGEDDWGNRVS
ncbi:MAG: DUF1127 domain-containing protein [Pseudomonadota bacterium]